MTVQEYISEIQKQYATGVAREHTYRPTLQNLLATLLPHLTVSNEPARQKCGGPDYILARKDGNIPVAFVEAKDLGDPDLGGRNKHNADGTAGRVWINAGQYFDGIPTAAWNFYVGGYQPAQKWLKDRSARTLSFGDILHYQRIIKALVMTEEIMQTHLFSWHGTF